MFLKRARLVQHFHDFYIGATLSLEQITGEEPAAMAVDEKLFNNLTPESVMKWE